MAEEPGRGRAVDADDATPRPLRELRVGARLEGVRAEDRRVWHELPGHVEEAERRLHAARPHRDRRAQQATTALPEHKPPRAAVDRDQPVDRSNGRRRGGDPAPAPVRTARNDDAVPAWLARALVANGRYGEDDLGPVVGPELPEDGDAPRMTARRRPDDDGPVQAPRADGLHARRNRPKRRVGRLRSRPDGQERKQSDEQDPSTSQ